MSQELAEEHELPPGLQLRIFPRGWLLKPFPSVDIATRQWRFEIRVFLLLDGNFNARVGADHNSWPTCLGHFGIGKMNENGQFLLEFCCYYGLCVSNTFFNMKLQHSVSWRHPRSKHWHQLDLILTRRSSLPSILITHSYQGADCDTDPSLVCNRVKLWIKRLYHTKKEGRPCIDISKFKEKWGICPSAWGNPSRPRWGKCTWTMGAFQESCV